MNDEMFDLLTTEVAGVRYHQRPDELEKLSVGSVLVLAREAYNRHDKNAIRVETATGQKLGYVPRVQAAWLSRMMDAGYDVGAVLELVEPLEVSALMTLRLRRLSPR